SELLATPPGSITEAGVRENINVAVRYLAAWLSGQGCVPINDLMEDAATAEIARAQLWQWARHPAGRLDDGRDVTLELIDAWLREETAAMDDTSGTVERASALLNRATHDDAFVEF